MLSKFGDSLLHYYRRHSVQAVTIAIMLIAFDNVWAFDITKNPENLAPGVEEQRKKADKAEADADKAEADADKAKAGADASERLLNESGLRQITQPTSK